MLYNISQRLRLLERSSTMGGGVAVWGRGGGLGE